MLGFYPPVHGSPGDQRVSLSEIISALSFALDLTEGARPGHALRSCMLGMRIAREIGVPDDQRSGLYYALLLKDVGCSSNSARMCQVFAADERAVKHRFKLVDRQKLGRPNREALSFIWNNVAPGASPFHRLRQISRMLRADGDLAAQMIETRCERGADILRKFGMGDATCEAVYALDEHWNGRGLPRHLTLTQIPLLARICAVAQHLDLFCDEHGEAMAIDSLVERSGVWFDPDLVRAVRSLHRRGELWTWCRPTDNLDLLRSVVMGVDPGSSAALAGDDIDLICEGFADVVDAKSSFTFRHSVGVTTMAVLISEQMGLSEERIVTVRRAALLHDIGKLAVSNNILDKPGPLTPEEWSCLRSHPRHSAEILSRVRAFGEIAQLAGEHHERLDGTGYPLGRRAPELSRESRILAVADMFSALMESRPYRPDFSPAEVRVLLEREVPHRLDPDCFDAVKVVADHIAGIPTEHGSYLSLSAPAPLPFALDASAIAI